MPVEPIEHISPVYDDGGSIDSMDIEIEFPELCDSCMPPQPVTTRRPSIMEQDELPF